MKDSHPPPPLTVSQLTNAIKMNLESTFPFIHLQGEITNFKVQTSGHLYFSLKDAHAQIGAVMFKAEASLLKKIPKGGDQVIIKGELNLYPPRGQYQIVVRELSQVGIGELLQKLELLKIKLHQMGWFKSAHKKQLPRFPKRIGVVTSPTGAVIQDILNVLSRRFSSFHLILNPVKVQGEGAALEIALAIEQFNRHNLVDVMIVGRGGGSLEDLWPFNEEIVAKAIFESQIPIISAVGHETDHCIADYVADVRAPTPSAAAEIVIAEKSQQLEALKVLKKRIQQALKSSIEQNRYRLQGILKHSLLRHPQSFIEWRIQKLDHYRLDMEQAMNQLLLLKKHQLKTRAQQASSLKPTNQISHFKELLLNYENGLKKIFNFRLAQERQKLTYQTAQIDHAWNIQQMERNHRFNPEQSREKLRQFLNRRFTFYRNQLQHLFELLQALNPKNALEKGYLILFEEKNRFIINSISKLKEGQMAKLLFFDGEATITINKIISHE